MTPENPLFKARFITALNVRMKKLIPANSDYTAGEMQSKIQAIAFTVLKDMGLKDWSVLIGVRPVKGGKAELGCAFKKIPRNLIKP